MMDFPFKRHEEEPPAAGQITVNSELLKQMEALNVGGVIHLTSTDGPRQYFVIRLPDSRRDIDWHGNAQNNHFVQERDGQEWCTTHNQPVDDCRHAGSATELRK
jgi:hypothetical protein